MWDPSPPGTGPQGLFRPVGPPPRPSSPRRPLVPRPSIVDGQIARFRYCRDTVCTPPLIQSGPPAGHDRRSIGSDSRCRVLAPLSAGVPQLEIILSPPSAPAIVQHPVQSKSRPGQSESSPVPQSRLLELHLGPKTSRLPHRLPSAKFHAYCTDCDGEAGNVERGATN